MLQRGFGRTVTVLNDALGALRAGSPDSTGVAVVCGTGAAVGARAPDGRIWHSSWWQEPQGSRHLAEKALSAVYRAELGIDPPTVLTCRVLEIFRRTNVESVLRLFTARDVERPADLSAVTRALLEEAAGGDRTAWEIVHGHGLALGDYALAAARQVGIDSTPFTLVLAGGVLRHPSTVLRDAIVARVLSAAPQSRPVMACFEPVMGALFLALETAGVLVDEVVLRQVEATLPPRSLFQT
jgi:N-acetylglucosamine kinase-like BadF-type ATPase